MGRSTARNQKNRRITNRGAAGGRARREGKATTIHHSTPDPAVDEPGEGRKKDKRELAQMWRAKDKMEIREMKP